MPKKFARPTAKRRSNKNKVRAKKKDPVFIDGQRPRPMYVDYKDLDLLTKLTNRQGKIVGRRKSGCTAASQHAVTLAVKPRPLHGARSPTSPTEATHCIPCRRALQPVPMPQNFQTSRRVEFRDTDMAGIAHFSVFFQWMEEAEHEFLRHVGLSVLVEDAEGAITWPRVAARCDFQSSIRFEETVQIDVRITRLGTKGVTYAFRLAGPRGALGAGEMSSVCCRVLPGGTLRSIPIPAWIREKLAPHAGA